MFLRSTATVAIAAWGVAVSASATAQEWTEIVKLTAADGGAEDLFGVSVALSGNHALIGSYEDDDRGAESGSAYLFESVNGEWILTAKLTAADGESGDRFGRSVALSGDRALIGAPNDDNRVADTGSAYVFEKIDGVWTQTAKLIDEPGGDHAHFGFSVALSGDTALVGAYGLDGWGYDAGVAYVFRELHGRWTQVAELHGEDEEEAEYFGFSVAVSGDLAVIGAFGDDHRGGLSGSAYAFENIDGVWIRTAKLVAADADGGDHFGRQVALSGDVALIGASGDDRGQHNLGAAYVFEHVDRKWAQIAKLTAADSGEWDEFGGAVAISGDRALVASYYNSERAPEAGAVYVFERVNGAWTQTAKLTATDGQGGDYFGTAVALSGDRALIGARGDDDRGLDSGSAYVFQAPFACAGTERMKVACRRKQTDNTLTVRLKRGTANDLFSVKLSSGPIMAGVLDRNGEGLARFKGVPPGRGTVTASWGCGAEKRRAHACP